MGGINPHVDAQKIFKFDLFPDGTKDIEWHNLLAFKNSKSFKHSHIKKMKYKILN